MIRISSLLLLLASLLPLGTFACGNEYETMTRPDGKPIDLDRHGAGTLPGLFTHGFDTTHLLKQKAILLQRLAQDSSYQDLSDLALLELRIGDRFKAVKILEKLHNQQPAEYNIVVNLGTAYEMIESNELAYRFIKKAIELNPESHKGSEWIHLNILEQKLKDMPDYTLVMNLGIGKSLKQYYSSLSQEQVQALVKPKLALVYQLQERIAFADPEDPAVAQLLLDLGDLVAMTESLERAQPIYTLAAGYGKDTPLLAARLQEVQEVPYQNPLENYWYWGVPGIAFAALAYYVFMTRFRRVKLNSQADSHKTMA